MIGFHHAIVIGFGIVGLVLGGVLIDLDHTGTWKCKWEKFWNYDVDCPATHGPIHQPLVMLSIMAFSLCLGLGLLIHIIMDGYKGYG